MDVVDPFYLSFLVKVKAEKVSAELFQLSFVFSHLKFLLSFEMKDEQVSNEYLGLTSFLKTEIHSFSQYTSNGLKNLYHL